MSIISEATTSSPLTISSNMNAVINQEYRELSPTIKSWFKSKIKNPKKHIDGYFLSYFPFVTWIYRYNFIWFCCDLIAGLTVGVVAMPQSMAYASLAKLAPQFGLYSSFVGGMFYWIFATSKVRKNKIQNNEKLKFSFFSK
jgi:sodium-independent sulfate anion transporter 11